MSPNGLSFHATCINWHLFVKRRDNKSTGLIIRSAAPGVATGWCRHVSRPTRVESCPFGRVLKFKVMPARQRSACLVQVMQSCVGVTILAKRPRLSPQGKAMCCQYESTLPVIFQHVDGQKQEMKWEFFFVDILTCRRRLKTCTY